MLHKSKRGMDAKSSSSQYYLNTEMYDKGHMNVDTILTSKYVTMRLLPIHHPC